MRLFAAAYAAVAVVAALFLTSSHDPIPWLVVCGSGALLGVAAAFKKPLLMLCGAHAGLTATWAGTLAARAYTSWRPSSADVSTALALVAMCVGMGVLIAAGLKVQPQPVPVRVKSQRRR